MNIQALLPSPNWFLNSLADCSPDGVLAYGSRNGLVLIRTVDVKNDGAAIPSFSLLPNAHRDKDRVTSVAFSNRSPSDDFPKYLLASSGDDNSVAIWDTDALELIQKHNEHRNSITGLDWSKTGDLLLVSADDKGNFAVWDLVKNDVRLLPILTTSARLSPNVLKCSPINQDIVAVGCKDGLVCIVSVKGTGLLVNRMRGHDKSVNSISWCPGTNKFASSGMDHNIIVWNNGQAEKPIQLPNKSLSGVVKVKPGEKQQSNLWYPILFLKPNLIVSGCSNAEVLSWDPTLESPSPTLLHSEHARGLFGLAVNNEVIWSLAQDRLLIRHDLASNATSIFPTLGGFAYCIAPCPFAPGRVAVGVGDETIRVWSLTDNTNKSSVSIWQRIKGKVLSLAWHPDKEGELAFGTSDGRVGICNASNASKEPLVMRQFHRQSVYRVAWGPPICKKDQECQNEKWFLYACDESSAVMYNDSGKPPCLLKTIIRASNPQIKEDRKHKDIAWKPDRSLLALGLEDGSIQLLTAPNLQCIHTLLSHKKMIFYLSWHPSSTAVDAYEERRQNWLASTAMDQLVHVYDLTPLLDEEKKWKGANLPLEPLSEMRHGGKVVSLAWNPHVGGQLLSSSYDMSVKVWDVLKKGVLACYIEHMGCVLSCTWSALDPDLIISGGADFTCRTWKVSEASPDNKPTSRPRFKEEKKGETLISAPSCSTRPNSPEMKPKTNDPSHQRQTEKLNPPKANKTTVFPIANSSFVKNAMECCFQMLDSKGLDPPGKRLKPEPNGTCKGDVQEDLNHFGFFTNQEDAIDLFKNEAETLKKMNNHLGLNNLKLWQGDLQQIIKDSAKAKKLDDWFVSMAPSVSHKFWLETCSAYADQLVEEEKILKAVSYLVISQRVKDAVEVLQKHKMFKEAVAICHLRLPSDDPLLNQTLRAWGKFSQDTGNYEIAVQCFVSVGDYEKAAVVLSKRRDPKMWQLGIFLANLADANDLSVTLTIECFYYFLTNQDWSSAKELIIKTPKLKHLLRLLQSHELICSKEKEGLNLDKVWNSTESILDDLEEMFKDIEDGEFQYLSQMFPTNSQLPENRKELLVATSKLLLLAGAAKASGSDTWERFVVQALHLNYRRSLVVVKEKPLHLLLSWLKTDQLIQYKASEESFRAAAYISSINKDDPLLFQNLLKYKAALLDMDCARFARLEVIIPDLEKRLAAAQAEKKDFQGLMEQLLALTDEREKLLEARVAFPNPLILFCKLQGTVDSLQSKVDQKQLDEYEADMDKFRAVIQG